MGVNARFAELGIYRVLKRLFRVAETGGVRDAAQAVRSVEEHAISAVDARHALTNLSGRGAATLDEFAPGAGFSGIYHPESGKFLAYPSGDTTLRTGAVPANRVERYGGHADVNATLCRIIGADHTTTVGFVAVMKDDGSLGMRWTSRSVNGLNPSFPGVQVPEHLRQPIMDEIARTTGRVVRSDV